MIKIHNISCVIIAKDAQTTITKALDALVDFEEIIIYLNNSTDKTKEIASKYANVTIVEGDFLGFGPTKNLAASYANNEWILSLDADEVVSQDMIKHLSTLKLNDKNVYSILRENYYKKIAVKHCWGSDNLIRLYNKEKTSFTNKKVHENIIIDNFAIEPLSGIVRHYPYATISDFIVKLDRYSTIYAQENAGKKNSSPTKALLNAQYSFFKTYFLKKGFLDGYAGLVIAFSHMATNFYKYIKLYELNKEHKKY